jgi:hypothetical protein
MRTTLNAVLASYLKAVAELSLPVGRPPSGRIPLGRAARERRERDRVRRPLGARPDTLSPLGRDTPTPSPGPAGRGRERGRSGAWSGTYPRRGTRASVRRSVSAPTASAVTARGRAGAPAGRTGPGTVRGTQPSPLGSRTEHEEFTGMSACHVRTIDRHDWPRRGREVR